MTSRRPLLAAPFLALPGLAQAQARYPNRPVRVIVALAAGGDNDLVTRLLTQRMSDKLGQPFVVENRPGAGSLVGHEAAARAAPDGYNLIMSTISALGANLALYSRLPYDPVNDFVPIMLAGLAPGVLVVGGSSPFRTPQDIVAAAKARPGVLTFGSAGNGNLTQLIAEVFKRATGIDVVHVPYRGIPDAQRDVAAGRVDFMFAISPSSVPLIEGGQLRALAVTSATRLAVLPQIRTMAELGYPDFDISSWYGLMAPRGTPPEIVATLNEAANEALRDPNVEARLRGMSVTPGGGSPQQFQAFIERERARWVAIVREAGITVD
ncbi:tripartite tricarboxylate transporter substrate binding protein [Roseococcus sp. SYP-B2431]|uniref:Bug family tripartite tricarboxylate transporter substrate binding protein n=1 Tax=Roseococcus sp. SYP-B2431 TaxID=2496640 RepID=UPI001040169D|nr:tripartite tricarboxylate transporter substrate binding protein [Roseococcus sp. SYP-B2431]TCH99504.1 tripartite tricarboxylate transporter substrate binding protein [Roseococcus sp. SYP-B2431]